MNELTLANQAENWHRLKSLVLDSVSSPITRRVYNLGLDEFIAWYGLEPRPGFTKATVNAWRMALEARGLGIASSLFDLSAGCLVSHTVTRAAAAAKMRKAS